VVSQQQSKFFASTKTYLHNFHLYFTQKLLSQYITIVKVYRVFPSSHKNSAFSQKIQFHKAYNGDSGIVITPFMQDAN
jgi:hypothetical protein